MTEGGDLPRGVLRGGTFHFPVRVYYEDTDQQGIVFYANYLRYFERGRTEYLRHLDAAPAKVEAQEGLVFVVARLDISYHRSATLDQVLDVQTSVAKLGRVKLLMDQAIYCEGQLVTSAKVTVAVVDRQGRPSALTPDLQARFTAVSPASRHSS